MFFALVSLGFRFLALFGAGATLSFLLFGGESILDALMALGFLGFVWLLAKLIDFLIPPDFQFKFLDTKKKRIIAAAASVVMGFLLVLYTP